MRQTPKHKKDFIEFMEEIHAIQDAMAEDLVIRDAGLTVHTRGDGTPLSPGCEACKQGTWLCLFVGRQCNATCKTCPQEITPDLVDTDHAFFGMWMHDAAIYAELFDGTKVGGVSYSGGEPLMYIDKILPVATRIREKSPDLYQWMYTNGILVDEEKLKQLQDAGLREIRFNLSATHFKPKVMAKLELAKRYIDRVTVEVPSLPETWENLIEQRKIHDLESAGVSQLNLAELYMINQRSWDTWKDEEIYNYSSNFFGAQSPVFSRRITCAIMKYAIDNDLKMIVNDCSNDTKHLQSVKRDMNPLLRRQSNGAN
jgi:pyruvate formate-lyase activating enzyme-like uncharacterized protein